MSLFSRRQSGWMGVRLAHDRIDLAHVCWPAGSKPQLKAAASHAREGDDAQALARLAKARGLRRMRCVTLLRPGDYQMFQVEAPAVPASELNTALRWRLKDLLDYPVEGATVDAVLIPQDENARGRAAQALAVAAATETVGTRIEPFRQGRVGLEVVDIPELAQRNVSALLEDENRGLALLSFDAGGGLLTFTYRGELYASRRIDIDADQFSGGGDAVREQLCERITLELQRSFDNVDRQFHYISVTRLVVALPDDAPWLLPCLANSSYVPVEVLDLGQALDLGAVPELSAPQRQASMLLTIGAALRPPAA
jgi:MSHA biogenesis protein MshI